MNPSANESVLQLYAQRALDLLAQLGVEPHDLEELKTTVFQCIERGEIALRENDPPRQSPWPSREGVANKGVVSDHNELHAECLQPIDQLLATLGDESVFRGLVLLTNGSFDLAEYAISLGLSAARLQGNVGGCAHALNAIGRVHKTRGNLRAAENFYKEAIDLARQIDDLSLISAASDNLGNVYSSQGKYEDSIHCYRQALDAARKMMDSQVELVIMNNLTSVYAQTGKIALAVETLREVIRQARTSGNTQAEALAADNLANLLDHQGRGDESEEYRLFAVKTFAELGNKQDESVALCNLSLFYLERGEIERAGSCFERAAEIMKDLAARIDITRYTIGRVHALARMERQGWDKLLKDQLNHHSPEADPLALIPVLRIGAAMDIGSKYAKSSYEKFEKHNYAEAEREMKLAISSFHGVGAFVDEIPVLSNLCALYMAIGDAEQALQCALRARELAHTFGDLLREASALVNLARLYRNFEELSTGSALNALSLLTQAEALLDVAPAVMAWRKHNGDNSADQELFEGTATSAEGADLVEEIKSDRLYNNLGVLHAAFGSFRSAERYFERAVAYARKRWTPESDPAGSYRLIYRLLGLAQVYEATGNTIKLKQIVTEVEGVLEWMDDPHGAFIAASRLGNYYWKVEGNAQKARALLEKALNLSDTLRQSLPRGSVRIRHYQYSQPPYEAAILLAVSMGQQLEAFELAERSRSRQFLESLAEALPIPISNVAVETLRTEREVYDRWIAVQTTLQTPLPEDPTGTYMREIFRSLDTASDLHAQLASLWDELESVVPEYVSLRQGLPLTFTEIRQIVSGL